MRELPPLEAKVLPFRRPSTTLRVRRKSTWLVFGKPFLQAAGIVVLPTALVAWTLATPVLGLSAVDVVGNRFVDSSWIESRLRPLYGENLLLLSLSTVEERVRVNPWIESVTIDKVLPNRLHLALVEKRPLALLRTADGLEYLDAGGRSIAPFDPERGPGDLLLVSDSVRPGDELAGAFAIADELARAAPAWAATLSEVEVLGDGDFRLRLGALPFPIVVRAGTLAERLPGLAELVPEIERRYDGVRSLDLRFSRRIVFQPAAAPRPGAADPEARSKEWPRRKST